MHATVADTREANRLIRLCRQHAHVPIQVSPIPPDDLTFVGFGDCGNDDDGGLDESQMQTCCAQFPCWWDSGLCGNT